MTGTHVRGNMCPSRERMFGKGVEIRMKYYQVSVNRSKVSRRIVFAVGVLLIAAIVWLLSAGLFNQDAVGSDSEMAEVVVEAGDSLWSICKELGVKGDIRRVIYQIKRINHLSDARIYPGQVLLIPIN